MADKANLRQNDVRAIRALLEELPELLDDYGQCAVDLGVDNSWDQGRTKRIRKVKRITKALLELFEIDWMHRLSQH